MKDLDDLKLKIMAHLFDSNHLQKPSIDSLCKHLLISKSTLYRYIKANTGKSIAVYIRDLKLEKAKELLIHSNIKIQEIAIQSGINSPQSFSKFFSKLYGLNPSEYRRRRSKL